MNWIDFKGELKLYATIASGSSFTQSSFLNHNWLLSNDDQNFTTTFELGVDHFKKENILIKASTLIENKTKIFQGINALIHVVQHEISISFK